MARCEEWRCYLLYLPTRYDIIRYDMIFKFSYNTISLSFCVDNKNSLIKDYFIYSFSLSLELLFGWCWLTLVTHSFKAYHYTWNAQTLAILGALSMGMVTLDITVTWASEPPRLVGLGPGLLIVFLATNTVDNVDIWGCGDYDIITLMMTVLYKPYVILFFAAILCNTAFLLDY